VSGPRVGRVVCGRHRRRPGPIGEAIYEVASEITDDAVIVRYPPGETHGGEPPPGGGGDGRGRRRPRADDQEPESHSRPHGRERGRARVATLPGSPRTSSQRAGSRLRVDRGHCRRSASRSRGRRGPRHDRGRHRHHVRRWRPRVVSDTGIVHDPGEMSNLPPARCSSAPKPPTGPFVVDGTMMPPRVARGRSDALVRGRRRFVTRISDDDIRETVEDAAETAGDAAYNLAELGIGTNVAAVRPRRLGPPGREGRRHRPHRDRRRRGDRRRHRSADPPRRHHPGTERLRRRRSRRSSGHRW